MLPRIMPIPGADGAEKSLVGRLPHGRGSHVSKRFSDLANLRQILFNLVGQYLGRMLR